MTTYKPYYLGVKYPLEIASVKSITKKFAIVAHMAL